MHITRASRHGGRTKRWLVSLFALPVSLLAGSCSQTAPDGCGVPPRELAAAINLALTPVVTATVRHSSRLAMRDGARPVPPEVRAALSRHFDDETLERVRWTTAGDRASLDSVVTHVAPRYGAMTLDHVIVFTSAAHAKDIDLWVHELLHVGQVRQAGGLPAFVRGYLANWPRVEAATIAQTNTILAELDVAKRQGPATLARRCA